MSNNEAHTSGSLLRSLIRLGLPMTTEMFLLSAYSLVDLIFVQRLGWESVAAVGAAGSILVLAIAISIGLSVVFGAVVSRRIGEGDEKQASVATATALFLSLSSAAVVCSSGYFLTDWAVGMLGLSGEVASLAASYLKIRFLLLPIGFSLFGLNACFRSAGQAGAALRFLLLANLINIALDPIFIFGMGPIPAFGVDGSAWATGLAQAVALVYQLFSLSKGVGPIRLDFTKLEVDFALALFILRRSMSAIPQSMVRMASHLLLTALVAYQSEIALAGFTAAVRVHLVAILPAFGLGNAVAALVGQNLGADRPDRAESAALLGAGLSSVYMLTLALLFWWQGENILQYLAPDADVLAEANRCLIYWCLTYPLTGAAIALESAFNGAGDTKTPLFLNLINRWFVQLGLAYVLVVHLDYGTGAIWRSANVADALMLIMTFWVFRRGKWKHALI